MRFRPYEAVAQGLVALAINPARTALSIVGIVIGVASVIMTLALADGLELYARDKLATATDVQSITISSRTVEQRDGFAFPIAGYPVFTGADGTDLQRRLGAGGEVSMAVSGRAIVASPPGVPHAATITATLANYLSFGRKGIDAGRFFTDGEAMHNTPVVILSHLLATELSPNGDPAQMVGRVVRVHGRPMTCVGVMPAYTGERGFQVLVPLRAAATTFEPGAQITPQLVVRAHRIESVEDVRAEIEEWLATRYRGWGRRVEVTTALARLEEAHAVMLVFKLIMASFAGIALLVGGVGIMNVLLASVAERTREIGVRKALGATRGDILLQFLSESVAIASVGSGLGTIIGFIGAFTVAALVRNQTNGSPLYAAITVSTVLLGVCAAALVGLTFGTFPALRAARLSPIDAIRHD